MKTELRYSVHPIDFKRYDTEGIRKEFIVGHVFIQDEINLVYSLYDRYIVGGAMPVTRSLKLESVDELKAEDFLDSLMSPLKQTDSGELVVGIKTDDAEAAQQVKDVITSFRYLADYLEEEYGKQVIGTYNIENAKLYLGH